MNPKEIRELLELKGWSQAQLAREIDCHESSVSLWISGERNPTGPTRILLRQWLTEARKEAENQPA